MEASGINCCYTKKKKDQCRIANLTLYEFAHISADGNNE